MSSTCQPLPVAWVERIFERFTACYGHQKIAAMWTGADPESVKSAWAEKLGGFPPDALAAAVYAVGDAHPSWPPTLGEFRELVRARIGVQHRRALPVPSRTADEIAAGRAQMDAIKSMLGRRPRRDESRDGQPSEAERVEPPVCRCWTGLQRAETLCEACASFRRNRTLMQNLRDGVADDVARDVA